jgi:hypothetical protein
VLLSLYGNNSGFGGAGDVAQVVEHLPSKYEAQSSNPVPKKEKKKPQYLGASVLYMGLKEQRKQIGWKH